IFFLGGATLACASQRTDGDLSALFALVRNVFLAHQNFWRGAYNLEVVEVPVVHIGRWVERAQSAVQRQRRIAEGLGNDLPHLYLHEVASHDVVFGFAYGSQVIV